MNIENKYPLMVFLCHSSNDKPIVRMLYDKLNDDGADAWLDEEKLLAGKDWDIEIRKAVRKSDVVIVCLSKNSVTKEGYIQKEIKFALDIAEEKPDGTIFLIPIKLDECNVPDRLIKWHWIHWGDETGYEKLINALKIRANEVSKEFHPLRRKWSPRFEKFGDTEFVYVPAGPFRMGSKETNLESFPDQHPQSRVFLSYDYLIARFPITNREFKKFVNDTGYVTAAETSGGWSFEKNNYISGINWKYPRYTSVGIQNKDNHPVVQMCWHDAVAYCKWLEEKWKYKLPNGLWLRLPTEAEWEKAARGTEGSEWPWGNSFDSKRCNTEENGLKDTTPVGIYSPNGDSCFGAADMTGNVWEWTHSLAASYPYNSYDFRESEKVPNNAQRILRGGSFLGDKAYTRCAYRYTDYSTSMSRYFGFRIVLSKYEII